MNINKKIRDKILAYAKHSSPEEIGGLLLGKIQKNGVFRITNAIILKQKRTKYGFELDDDDMMDFTKNSSAKTLESVIGWWHSHGKGELDFSDDDDRTFERLCTFLDGSCVGVLVTVGKNSGMKFRVDMEYKKTGERITLDDVVPTILGNKKKFSFASFASLKLEIDKKVVTSQDAEVNWNVCTTCSGSGLVFSDTQQKAYQDMVVEQESPQYEGDYYGR